MVRRKVVEMLVKKSPLVVFLQSCETRAFGGDVG